MKLSNFLAIDPVYAGKGMERYGKRDEEVFVEFAHDRERLRKIASTIREAVGNDDLREKLYHIQDEEDRTLLWQVKEGKVLYKLHKLRERDYRIVQEKKELVYQQLGHLLCEACEFNFERTYGRLGEKYPDTEPCRDKLDPPLHRDHSNNGWESRLYLKPVGV